MAGMTAEEFAQILSTTNQQMLAALGQTMAQTVEQMGLRLGATLGPSAPPGPRQSGWPPSQASEGLLPERAFRVLPRFDGKED
eukprot:10131634-Lingulodinium_polyedra.AAC.1